MKLRSTLNYPTKRLHNSLCERGNVLSNFLIGLREGLEAALLISILLGYLVRTNRRNLVRYVVTGVGVAVVFSVLIAALLESISAELSEQIEPYFAGTISLLAVLFVTWMIFWMKKSATTISGDLKNRLDSAAMSGGEIAVAFMAFTAVSREGIETAVFFWAAAHASGSVVNSLVGLIAGLILAIALGVAFYKSTLRINLTKFFRNTGILLAIVAAGIGTYGIHEFQEVGLLPGEDFIVLDLSNWLREGSIQASILAGLFNIHAKTSMLQAIAWLGYLATVLTLFLRPVKTSQPLPASAAS